MSEVVYVRRAKPGEEGGYLADGVHYRFNPGGPERISSKASRDRASNRKGRRGKDFQPFVILNGPPEIKGPEYKAKGRIARAARRQIQSG